VTQALANAMGLGWNYTPPVEIMDEIARLTPTFAGVSHARLEPKARCNGRSTMPRPMAARSCTSAASCAGKGKFVVTDYVPTDEKTGPRFPLLLTTGRILSQYNVGAQTRRTANTVWHEEDVLEIHPPTPRTAASRRRLGAPASRKGETTLRAEVTDRVAPGVVYTTFHHPRRRPTSSPPTIPTGRPIAPNTR
jgi:formate dehydrogenase major subunit